MAAEYRTTDMSLAAFLHLEGHWYDRVERIHNKTHRCLWVYDSSERVMELVELYHDGEVQVDPVTFTQRLADVRGAMYEFLSTKTTEAHATGN